MVNYRECLDADKVKPSIEPMVTTVTRDIGPMKQELVSRGGDQNTEHVNSLRFEILLCFKCPYKPILCISSK